MMHGKGEGQIQLDVHVAQVWCQLSDFPCQSARSDDAAQRQPGTRDILLKLFLEEVRAE